MRFPIWYVLLAVITGCAAVPPGQLVRYRIEADAIRNPIAAAGDAVRGREVLMSRDANCLLCHAVPETGARFMGNIGPVLSGAGGRLSAGQLRLRVIDQSRINRDTVMPAYYRVDGLNRVAIAYQGKPILDAQQVEDVVAYLTTLK